MVIAANDPRQLALNQMWEYLINQGIMGGYQFPTYDSAYLQDVQKMYEDTVLGDPMMFYDTVLPKYRARYDAGDPRAKQMIGYFDLIEREGYSPDTFLKDTTIGSQLTENEKADLATYASEKEARDKAAYKFNQDMAAKAALYEVPDPFATYNLPLNIVQDLIRDKRGATPQEAASKEILAIRAAKSKEPKQMTTVYENAPMGFSDNVLAGTQNAIVDALNWFDRNIARPVRGALRNISYDMPGVDIVGNIGTGIPQSAKYMKKVPVKREVTTQQKLDNVEKKELDTKWRPGLSEATRQREAARMGGPGGGYLEATQRKAENSAMREVALQEALVKEIMARFGTPFDIAVKEAARIAASRKRGASGNWPS